jgi:hypothetical protein
MNAVVVAALLAAAGPGVAPETVTSATLEVFGAGGLRHEIVKDGEAFTLYGENTCHGPLTVEVALQLTNVAAQPFEKMVVIPARTRVVLARMRLVEPKRPYTVGDTVEAQLGSFRAKHEDRPYSLPWPAPKTFRVAKAWNEKPDHLGNDAYAVDVAMPASTPILAAREGVVAALHAEARDGGAGAEFDDPRKGNWVVVAHADGTWARYENLRRGGVAAALGQRVRRGELLGYSGATGRAPVPQLHFMVGHPTDARWHLSVPFRWKPLPGGAADTPVLGEHPTAYEFGGR